MSTGIDVFLSYHSTDRKSALDLARELRLRRVEAWIADDGIRPGEAFQTRIQEAIRNSRSAAILIGPGEIGQWQQLEIEACLQESVRRRMPVIPVLLPDAADRPLPPFLDRLSRVDLRRGVSDDRELSTLVRGINGAMVVEATAAVVKVNSEEGHGLEQPVDAWAAASIKARLHAAAEVVASEAAGEASLAAAACPSAAVALLVPLIYDMRWGRGYLAGLERLLRARPSQRQLGDFDCVEVSPPCGLRDGLLTAGLEGNGILVKLDGQSAARLTVRAAKRGAVIEAINTSGRLGPPRVGGMSLIERIREVPIVSFEIGRSAPLAALYRNRQVLAVLVARMGMPGSDWLLPSPGSYPRIGLTVLGEDAPDLPDERHP